MVSRIIVPGPVMPIGLASVDDLQRILKIHCLENVLW